MVRGVLRNFYTRQVASMRLSPLALMMIHTKYTYELSDKARSSGIIQLARVQLICFTTLSLFYGQLD